MTKPEMDSAHLKSKGMAAIWSPRLGGYDLTIENTYLGSHISHLTVVGRWDSVLFGIPVSIIRQPSTSSGSDFCAIEWKDRIPYICLMGCSTFHEIENALARDSLNHN